MLRLKVTMFDICSDINEYNDVNKTLTVGSHYNDTTSQLSMYANVLTPPSSGEDSPASINMLLSPPGCLSPRENFITHGIVPKHMHLNNDRNPGTSPQPYLKIMEQPMDRFRFRYKSEMSGTHGSLMGIHCDKNKGRKQTFPTVELFNFNEPAVIRCSLYQVGEIVESRQPHAHRLVKRILNEELDDPHSCEVSSDNGYIARFHNMGIIHTAKKNIVGELTKKKTFLRKEEILRNESESRELNKKEEAEIRMLADSESKSINLNVVCLRFEAFTIFNNVLHPVCSPVYSHGINNLKSALTGDLKIVRMDHCSSPSRGGREIFLLVEKVTKKNIRVRFFETDEDDIEIWSADGKFSDLDVHHQYAIVFRTPPYKLHDIETRVQVFIELVRPSDGARSESKCFTYTPSEFVVGKKRAHTSYSSYGSSYNSNEIPVTIENMCIEQKNSEVSSVDIEKALEKIDSAEFKKLTEHFKYNANLFEDYSESEFQSILGSDAPPMAQRSYPLLSSLLEEQKFSDLQKCSSQLSLRESIYSTSVEPDDIIKLRRTLDEVKAFFKTKPPKERVVLMLKAVFRKHVCANGNTALHTAITINNTEVLNTFLRIIVSYQQTDILNIQNRRRETCLHIATLHNNWQVVLYLVKFKADVSLQSLEGNTALHLVLRENRPLLLLQKLLDTETVSTYINILNFDEGKSALHMAVENSNIEAVKLLCSKGADVNLKQRKDDFTALHIAVQKQNVDIIKTLLYNPVMRPNIDAGLLQLAQVVSEDSKSQIYEIFGEYMAKHCILTDTVIKKEVEERDSEEEMEIDEIDIKSEPLSPYSPVANKKYFAKVTAFTDECLVEICALLDRSGNWQHLAELLDYGHLLRSDLFTSVKSPSKTLLTIALESGDSVLRIRDFLENLDEVKAVQIIDNMAIKNDTTHTD